MLVQTFDEVGVPEKATKAGEPLLAAAKEMVDDIETGGVSQILFRS